jgi:lysyl-tRNA synthetase class II
MGREVYPLDRPFLAALEQGLPPSGGIALGVDRFVLLLANAPGIRNVIPFADEM